MSTASQRRRERREHLQRPFAEKVREIAESLPRRPPALVDGMKFVDRIETIQPFETEIRRDLGYPRRVVYLKKVLGDDVERLPRTFCIPFIDPATRFRGRLGDPLGRIGPRSELLEFTWRSYGVNAGDTSVRWFQPELIGQGATDKERSAQYAARKVSAYARRAISMLQEGKYGWIPPHPLYRMIEETLSLTAEALDEFMGETDPASTRPEREAEARATP